RDDGDMPRFLARSCYHLDRDFFTEHTLQPRGELVERPVALAGDAGAAGNPLRDRPELLELSQVETRGDETRRRHLWMHVERCVDVIEADPVSPHALE